MIRFAPLQRCPGLEGQRCLAGRKPALIDVDEFDLCGVCHRELVRRVGRDRAGLHRGVRRRRATERQRAERKQQGKPRPNRGKDGTASRTSPKGGTPNPIGRRQDKSKSRRRNPNRHREDGTSP